MLSRELIEKNVDIVLQMPSLFDKVEQCLITGDLVAASAILENTASFRVYFESVFKRIKLEIPYDGKDITVVKYALKTSSPLKSSIAAVMSPSSKCFWHS